MKRYLVNFDTDQLEKCYSDVLIIGSGIAGVYTALELSEHFTINMLTKEEVEISNSVLAQGGIAVSLDKNDSPEEHMKDTLYAGAGLCDEESVDVLVHEAADNIHKICDYGVQFDKNEKDNSQLALGREAAHSKNRIIHAGDATGKEVCDKLIHTMLSRKNVSLHERIWAVDLLVDDQGECRGVLAYDETEKAYKVYYAAITICASGGYGQLYYYTTNPEVATGDGAAMTYRAGGELTDMEFVQFHPTVLYHEKDRSFLISEAVRGDGALLRNASGERFMPRYHELNELAPRDVVSRSIFSEMQKTGESHMNLDITMKDRAYLEKRFPTIFQKCLGYGIDLSKDYIPIAPAEHYCMGGIKTGLYGNTSIKRFYACGEAACTGIHGANRLASNSLLEGLVFGRRIGIQAQEMVDSVGEDKMPRFVNHEYPTTSDSASAEEIQALHDTLKRLMTKKVGIVRTQAELEEALAAVRKLKDQTKDLVNDTLEKMALQNEVLLAEQIIQAAILRKESRGGHFRSDFPNRDDEHWKCHIVITKEGTEMR